MNVSLPNGVTLMLRVYEEWPMLSTGLNYTLASQKTSDDEFDDRCAGQRRALSECANQAAKKRKVGSTVNYHLQRLSRLLK